MKKKIIKLIFILTWLILFLTISAFGSSEVGPDGSFYYSIKLNLPPATGGMGPDLSLTYNSEAGNGLVGAGWQLQGYDAVSRDFRYPVNLDDSLIGGTSDHYIYMGQRLFNSLTNGWRTESESYLKIERLNNGPNSPLYYWKVLDKNGVAKYYGYRATDGGITSGGGYIYSRSASSNDPARLWALDQVMDVNGNYYTIDYIQNKINLNPDDLSRISSSFYPDRIIYTRNDTSNPPINTFRMVKFIYSSRTDKYVDSRPTPVANEVLLTKIEVYTNVTLDSYGTATGTLHHYYVLTYDCNDSTANKSMLKKFQEFSGDNTLSRPPLYFTYTPNHQVNLKSVDDNASVLLDNHTFNYTPVRIMETADFDGDGKDDIMTYSGDKTVMIHYSRPGSANGGFPNGPINSRSFTNNDWEPEYEPFDGITFQYDVKDSIITGDFNGDGKTDFMLYKHYYNYVYPQIFYLYLSKPESETGEFNEPVTLNFGNIAFIDYNTDTDTFFSLNTLHVGDFNGDGKDDLISLSVQNYQISHSADWKVFLAKADGSGFDTSPSYIYQKPYNGAECHSFDPEFFYMGDFNSDGCMDFLTYCGSTNQWILNLASIGLNGSFSFIIQQEHIKFDDLNNSGTPEAYFYDFNGDGKLDVLTHKVSGIAGSWWTLYYISPSTLFDTNQFNATNHTTFISTEDVEKLTPDMFGDFNGDGMTDILICSPVTVKNEYYELTCTPFLATGTSMKYCDSFKLPHWPTSSFDLNTFQDYFISGDFDGNGMTDFMYRYAETSNIDAYYYWKIMTSAGNGKFYSNTGTHNSGDVIDITKNAAYRYFTTTIPNGQSGFFNEDKTRIKHKIVCTGNFKGDGKTSFVVSHSIHTTTQTGGFTWGWDYDRFEVFTPESTTRANLLTSIYNGQGGTIEINYTPAPAFIAPDGENDAVLTSASVINSKIPDSSFRNLVKEVIIHSGIEIRIDNDSYSGKSDITGYTQYKYHNGLYFPGVRAERCALGFEYIDTIDTYTHCKTRTYYYQEKPYQGAIKSVETYGFDNVNTDGTGGILMTKNETFYNYRQDFPSTLPKVKFVYKYMDKFTNYDKTGASISYVTQYSTYDEYGNNTTIENFGNPNTSNDDITTYSYFAINPDTYLMKIWQIKTAGRDKNGLFGLATHTIKYFDGATTAFTDTQTTSSNTFAGKGQVTAILSKAGATDADIITSFAYDSWGNCTTITDARFISTVKVYDNKYHMLVTKETIDPNGLNQSTKYSYDNFMNNVSITDTNNVAVTRTIYNSLNDPIKVLKVNDTTDDPGVTIFYDYSEKHLGTDGFIFCSDVVKTITQVKPIYSGLEPVLNYKYYDGLGRLIRDAVLTAVKDDNYDKRWRLTDYVYDHAGRLLCESIPYNMALPVYWWVGSNSINYITTYYDFAGRPYKTVYPDGTCSQIIYKLDATGLVDKNGHYTETQSAGNIKYAKEFTGTGYGNIDESQIASYFSLYAQTTTKEYRGGTSVTDTKGNETTTVINMLGRTKQITSPDMGTWSFTYDNNGNKLSQTDAKNQTIHYTYDSMNRLIIVTYPDNSTTQYYYDGDDNRDGIVDTGRTGMKGKLTKIVYKNGYEIFTYNNTGKLTSKEVNIDGISKTEHSSYYQTGFLATKTLPDNEVLHYYYHMDGTVKQVASSLNTYILSTEYNIRGQMKNMIKGNNLVTSCSYYETAGDIDSYTGLPFSYQLKSETSGIYGTMYNYNYDKKGNMTVKTSLDIYGDSASYVYDSLDRLTRVASSSFGNLTYDYDTVGNITSKDGYTFSYFNGTNRIRFDGRNYYQYDANGNIVTKSTDPNYIADGKAMVGNTIYYDLQSAYNNAQTGLTIKTSTGHFLGNITADSSKANNVKFSGGWDSAFNSVTGFTTFDGQIANNSRELSFDKFILNGTVSATFYNYDYNNMLISTGGSTYAYFNEHRVKKVENNVTTRYFFNDYEEEISEASTNVIKYYPGGAFRSTTDGLLYIYKDISGNISAITNSSGSVIRTLRYDPFATMTGETVHGGTGLENIKYRFSSKELDESGLTYFGARYYDKTIGRFITPDTIVPGASPQCLNRYSYCGNNPVNYNDMSGHNWVSDGFWGMVCDVFSFTSYIADYVTKPILKYTLMPLEKMGFKEIHFGGWIGIGGEVSINCETGDYNLDVGSGAGVRAGASHKYADIGGDCSVHMGLGYDSADKSLFFKAGMSASASNYGMGYSMTLGYSFKNHVGYQDVNITFGPASFGMSIYGSSADFYASLSFGGLSGSWSYSNGFSLGASLSDEDGNSVGLSYNVNNGSWRGSVSLEMCFVAGTKIETQEGLKNIEEIKTGDIVKSYNDQTSAFGYKEVVRTMINHTDRIVKIQIGSELIECTIEHPFYVIGLKSNFFSVSQQEANESGLGTWVHAGDLAVGMKLLSSDGSIKIINSVDVIDRHETTYNFEVADWHTYCVGRQNIVVHNKCTAEDRAKVIAWAGSETVANYFIETWTLESGFDTTAVSKSGAAGLAQWLNFGGYTSDEIAWMSIDEQLELATKYYGNLNQYHSAADVHLKGCGYGAFEHRNDDSYVIWSVFSKKSSAAYKAQKPYDLNKDGQITVGEAKRFWSGKRTVIM